MISELTTFDHLTEEEWAEFNIEFKLWEEGKIEQPKNIWRVLRPIIDSVTSEDLNAGPKFVNGKWRQT